MFVLSWIGSKISTFFRNIIYDDGVNPLKWKIILPVFFTSFFSTMVLNMVFPFLPKLVKSFGVSEVDAGFKVGIVGSSLFVGRFFGSFIWGLLTDIFKRKNVAIASGLASAITTLAFGFTFNFTWAVVTRFLQGLSSGFIVVARTMINDMTDETNRHLGMALLISSYNSALVIGSSLGGFLAFPVEQYPNVFQAAKLFEQFGVLLPCLVPFTCLLISCLLLWIYVPKSVKTSTHHDQEEQERSSNSQSESNSLEYSERTYLLGDYKETKIKYYIQMTNLHNKIVNMRPEGKTNASKDSKILGLLRERGFVLCAILFGLYSFAAIGYEEVFPVYAATSKRYHGFGFSPSLIGTYLLSVAVFTLVMQFTLIPKIVKRFGPRKTLMFASLIKAVCLPLVSYIELVIENQYLFWTLLLPCLVIIRNTMATSFLCISLLVNNSTNDLLLGTANGIAFSTSTLGRAISIPVVGALYSWSLTNIQNIPENHHALGFPFDHHFVFLLLAVISLACAIYSFFLPKSLDHSYQSRYTLSTLNNNDNKNIA